MGQTYRNSAETPLLDSRCPSDAFVSDFQMLLCIIRCCKPRHKLLLGYSIFCDRF